MFKIMVVEDDKNTRKLMETVLERSGYRAISASDGAEALELLDRLHIDLIVLDVMMPNIDGYELTYTLREHGYEIPILMVTAKESLEDKKRGFLSGTDDYMVKPVDEEEMLLRIAALLRRYKATSDHQLTIGSTKLDYNSMTVSVDGESQELPQKEFLILFKLLSYRGKIFTRRQLMDEIWGPDTDTDGRTVDVHINRIRDRLKGNDDFEIVTVRGLGYKAVANHE
ncbi:heme response regulator HssR [Andreesenia angusta]|uniref:Heme response regulator HssR n=1 Tax=Andreesenia angusta TaxID=39480 RepID=A0A1S1V612_9FIRM|nr:response regulator transcription factor [Andreesenia angusta]OHW62002.1 heme response regulator HssR [Andreesenia angusta]